MYVWATWLDRKRVWVALCDTWVFGSVLGSRGMRIRIVRMVQGGCGGFVVRLFSIVRQIIISYLWRWWWEERVGLKVLVLDDDGSG